jgi:4'-phosphopantetheinyl transferase
MSRVIVFSCQVNLLDEAFFTQAQACLSESERVRFKDCHKLARQQQFLAGHLLLRKALSQHFEQPEEYWHIQQAAGEPIRLLNPITNTEIYLSLSHSKERVVCALSLGIEVGIDIENTARNRPFVEFSQQYLTRKEIDKLVAKKGSEQKHYFYRLWTIMESVGKAQGIGLDKTIFNGEWLQDSNELIGYSCFSVALDNEQLSLALNGSPSSEIEYYEYGADNSLSAKPLTFERSSFRLYKNSYRLNESS